MTEPEAHPNDQSPAPDPSTPAQGIARDWRYWVGGLGRVLLVFGLLVFGFLAYQLWGTGIEYRQSQDALGQEFEQRQETLATDNSAGITTTTAAITEEFPTTSVRTASSDSVPNGSTGVVDPTTSKAPSSSTAARKRRWPSLAKGDALAIIEIPSIRKRVYAVAGVAPKDLKRGLGHYPGTPLPGQFGNASFAGHRTTYGAPLFNIDKLKPGDEIIVSTLLRERFIYVVTEAPRVIESNDVSVIATTDRSVASLTLTSCHPKYSAKQRIMVTAVLDASRSGTVEEATPEIDPPAPSDEPDPVDLDNPLEPGVSDPAIVTASSIEDANTAGNVSGSGSTAGTGSTIATGAAASNDDATDSATADDAPIQVAGSEGLASGWFTDSGAWWDVVAWVVVELAVVAGAWFLGRRYKRRWLGYVVAAVPFLVVLYFVYQNINRLLPADI